MTLEQNIASLGEYFVLFNIKQGIAYVQVNFPRTWKIFPKETVANKYEVQLEMRQEGTYFLAQLTTGIDTLFEAVRFVINNNRDAEQKSTLLQQKANELKELL